MNLPRYRWCDLDEAAKAAALQRPAMDDSSAVASTVKQIITRVRRDGDEALVALALEFDGATLASLMVTEDEFEQAEAQLSQPAKAALRAAIKNIRAFHAQQVTREIDIETMPGVRCQRLTRPIEAVGLYVPAGTAPLPSAAMMLAVPAMLAGCTTIVLCSPPRADASIDPAILYAARCAGISQVVKAGGAQAIAAMAYGTRTVPKVGKVFGPGNTYVTQAKAQVAADPDGAAQDMPAGPSEVLVIADADANPAYVAADLLSQAEHGADSQVVLLCESAALIDRVMIELAQQRERLSRDSIVGQALSKSALIEVASVDQAIDISNRYAPEHLILQVANARNCLPRISNAGSVFLGALTPESLGDYCSGTNHVLPTYGYARNYSGLGVEDFQRRMSVQEVTEQGLRNVGPIASTLAQLEGLDAHKLAVDLRLADVGGDQ